MSLETDDFYGTSPYGMHYFCVLVLVHYSCYYYIIVNCYCSFTLYSVQPQDLLVTWYLQLSPFYFSQAKSLHLFYGFFLAENMVQPFILKISLLYGWPNYRNKLLGLLQRFVHAVFVCKLLVS